MCLAVHTALGGGTHHPTLWRLGVVGYLALRTYLGSGGIPCVCVKWEPGPTASGGSPSGGGQGAQSSGQIGPPESPAASGPLSGLSAAGVSSPRKGLALSSPPSEASTPVDPGDRAQVGSFWGSGGWLRQGDSCHCRLQWVFSVPFPLALDVEVHWPGQGTGAGDGRPRRGIEHPGH